MSSTSFDVVVVGNAGIDTNIYLYGADIDFNVEANFTENIDYLGQAGGYASRGYAALGRTTAFIGYVGDDFSGRYIREEFARQGIDTQAVFIDPQGTCRSVNIMYRDGRRKNFYDGKSHMQLQPDLAVCAGVLSGTRLAHFNIPNWGRRLLPLARATGATIAVDIQDVVNPDDPYRRDFVAAADILFFSAANQADPVALAAHFQQLRPSLIVIAGLGTRGCLLASSAGTRHFPAVELPLPVIDTNGAGDSLALGFLTSYVLEGRSLEESINRGQIVARYTCAQRAPKAHLISAAELTMFERSQRSER